MFVRILFVSLIASFAACATPEESCKTNDTRACSCPGGTVSAQACKAGTWGECACGNPGSPDGGMHGDNPDAKPAGPKHGDICVSPSFDCGQGNNLVCVVDHQGDTQGVCRFACGGFSDCLQNPQTSSKLDTDCCDIGNGSRVCGQSDNWPAGACD